MPLTYLGQLKPTMEQQIALQRALLKLIREDEEMRRKAAEKPVGEPKRPALARRLVEEPMPPHRDAAAKAREIYEGRKAGVAAPTDWPAVQERALARQLKGAEPTPGYISGEERMRTAREKIAGEKEELAGKAGEFWERITPLDDEGRKVALDAAKEYQPQLYDALIEQGFVDPATGEAVRPEVERKVAFRETRITEGWEYEDITYADGTTESRILGVAPKDEIKERVLTPSEELGWARLHFDVAKAGEIHVTAAMKARGPAPIEGITMVERPGAKKRKATAEDVVAHWQAIKEDANFRRISAEGIKSVDDARTIYQHDTEAIKNMQRNIPGMIVDGEWSDALGQFVYDEFFKEEE